MFTRQQDLERSKLIDHMIIELENPYKVLTKWEEQFIESVTDQWRTKSWLSERQFEILEKIYAEKTL